MRGGVSVLRKESTLVVSSSPRAWGCFSPQKSSQTFRVVFPTCVGVFLLLSALSFRTPRLPHVRGGVSSSFRVGTTPTTSSPRAWGCFLLQLVKEAKESVFPTCVGVFLVQKCRFCIRIGLPHVRGGVSPLPCPPCLCKPSSPRAWGCFSPSAFSFQGRAVFPTCVGVFLRVASLQKEPGSLPHVRGGVSLSKVFPERSKESSPRAWGCFFLYTIATLPGQVFPTCVGVFPQDDS